MPERARVNSELFDNMSQSMPSQHYFKPLLLNIFQSGAMCVPSFFLLAVQEIPNCLMS